MHLHERLEDAFTVELIMTPREQLYCVEAGKTPSPDADYDLIPVYAQGTETIVGVLVRRDGSYQQEPLSEERLVSSGTSIRHLIQVFMHSQPPHSLLVVDGGMIVGVVSRADLGKVASRAYLYTLFAEIEYLLTYLIRRDIGDQKAFDLLRSSRQRKVMEIYEKQRERDEETNLVEAMHLADLIEVARKDRKLRTDIQRCMGSKGGLGMIEDVRNDIAHPNRELSVEQMLAVVPVAEKFIKCLCKLAMPAGAVCEQV